MDFLRDVRVAIKGQVMRDRHDLLELQLSLRWRWRAFFAQVNKETVCLLFLMSKHICRTLACLSFAASLCTPVLLHALEPLSVLKVFITVAKGVFEPTVEGSPVKLC